MDGRVIGLNDDLLGFFNKPTITDALVDIFICAVPIWVAVMIGLLIGWSWRPRWTGLVFLGLRSKVRFIWTLPPGLGARRLWLAFTALSAFSVCRRLCFRFRGCKRGNSSARGLVDSASAAVDEATGGGDVKSITGVPVGESNSVTEKDLEHLLYLLDGKDGEMAWQCMMERSTSNLSYQAWCHDPETGPTVYRSKTIFEDATAELVRDFFWDDDFRPKWDPMLAYCRILEERPDTGIMIVHWIKKFPFFCSDREYVICRRIWKAGTTYYCLTKGVPYPALPKRNKPRRVDLYFSSWVIKPVQSRRGDGQLSACEVTLIHYEDMGIPKDVAKLGVRHGMWGTVKKLHTGFRAYQTARKLEAPLTRCAFMARITTNISDNEWNDSIESVSGQGEKIDVSGAERRKDHCGIDWKWLAIGGTVALVCGLQTGLIGKVLLIAAGNRAAQRRANPR